MGTEVAQRAGQERGNKPNPRLATPEDALGATELAGRQRGQKPAYPDGPSIFTAIQEQLGLRLESQKGPVETIVIDRVKDDVKAMKVDIPAKAKE